MHNFIFGVFNSGQLVFAIGQPTYCSHNTAALIVGILDLAKAELSNIMPGCYFACDYWSKQWNIAERF